MIARTNHNKRSVLDILCRMSTGAALGGIGAGLFGTAFAALGLLAAWDLAGILPVAGYLALCGIASGGLVGIVCATVEVSESSSGNDADAQPPVVLCRLWGAASGALVGMIWGAIEGWIGRRANPDRADCTMPSCRDARN